MQNTIPDQITLIGDLPKLKSIRNPCVFLKKKVDSYENEIPESINKKHGIGAKEQALMKHAFSEAN